MMKLLLTYLLLGIGTFASAQTIDKTAMASGGESLSDGNITLNLTLGEPLIGVIKADLALDQGFWAGGLLVQALAPEEELGGISVFPNPVEDQLNIFTNNQRVFGLTMFSVDGRMVFKKKVNESQTQHIIDASTLSKGIYILRVFVEGESKEKLFKVIKN